MHLIVDRGHPVGDYGAEQGFTGDGGDKDAREDMFANAVPVYEDNDLIGTDATTSDDNFDRRHPLYRAIRDFAAVYDRHPALRSGAQIHRYSSDGPGVYAFSRIDRDERIDYVVALNNSEQAQTASIPTYVAKRPFQRVYGQGADQVRSAANTTLPLTVPPRSTRTTFLLWTLLRKLDLRLKKSRSTPPNATPKPTRSSAPNSSQRSARSRRRS